MNGSLRDGERTRQTQVLQLLGQGIRIQGHQSRNERLLIANQHRLRNQGRGTQMSLRNTRNHVLTAGGDNDFLLAAHNLQVAALVETSQVTGTEPTVLSERLSVLFGVLVVAANHAHTTNQKLAVLSDIAFGTGDERADHANLVRVDAASRNRGAGLGQTVTLNHLHTHRVEEVRQALAEGTAAGDRVTQLAAQGCTQLGVDQLVVQSVLRRQLQRDTALNLRLRPAHRNVGGTLKESLIELTALSRLRHGALVHLLKDAGHHQQHGRLEAIQVSSQVLNIGGVTDNQASVQRQHLNQARQNVCQRQEKDGGVAGVRNLRFDHPGVDTQVQEMAVSQRATLGATGRTGGVHNGREVITTGCGTYLLQLLIAHLGRASTQNVKVAVLNDPAVLELARLRSRSGVFFRLSHTIQEFLILDEDCDSLRMGQCPRRLGGGVRLIHRHGDSAGIPNREVDDGPLKTGAAHNAHAVTRADARGNQALSQVGHHLVELLGANRLPVTRRHLTAVQHRIGTIGTVALNNACQVQRRVDKNLSGSGEDFHNAPFKSERQLGRSGPRAVLNFSRCRDGFLMVPPTAAGDAFAGLERVKPSEFSGLGMRQKLEQ